MINHVPTVHARAGHVAPLTALLIVPLMGMMAFSIDLGYAVVVNTQLQNAADAAALAGAQQLMDPYVEYFTPGNTAQQQTILSNAVATAAKTAKAVANYNAAGQVNITLLDADIDVGYLQPNGAFVSSKTGLASLMFPNTVRVTARRDSSANGVLKLFFGRVFGRNSISMNCFAQASIYVVNFTGVNQITQNLKMLPLAYDRSTWKDILYQNISTSDGTDANGDRIMHIYPLPGNNTNSGAFGYLSLNNLSVNANDITSWINSGMSPTDLSSVKNSGLFPLPLEGQDTANWQGAPGFKNTDVDLINSLDLSKTYLLPLFKAYSGDNTYTQNNYDAGLGSGANNYYDIRDFVSVKLVPTGNTHKDIYVRPSPLILNADQIFGAVSLAGGGSVSSDGYTLNTIFVAPRLSQ